MKALPEGLTALQTRQPCRTQFVPNWLPVGLTEPAPPERGNTCCSASQQARVHRSG
jgi:hypothetical protein